VLCINIKATAVFLTVLLTTALATTYNIEKAWAGGTIYIKPDGSVDPSAAPIQRAGDIYTFVDNIYDTIVVQRDNIIIDGNGYILQGTGSGIGIDISNGNNVTIKKTHIAQFDYGIHLYKSNSSIISDNNLTNNIQQGIFISNSSSNVISRNNVVSNVREGIFLWLTNTTTVTGNNVSINGGDGISIAYSSFYNTIINNTVSHNSEAGISLGWEISTGNVISGNNITNNVWAGIYIDHSNGNTLYHNNLLYNTNQVVTVGATNAWDNGYPSGGNYWGEYTDIDLYWGPSQSETGSDGIGDTPRTVDGGNRDNYPLMSPYEYWSNPIPGDINKDMKVDNNDLYQLAIAYGSSLEKPNWNPNSDINSDNIVSVSDLFRLGKNFGKPADNTSPNGKTPASARWK